MDYDRELQRLEAEMIRIVRKKLASTSAFEVRLPKGKPASWLDRITVGKWNPDLKKACGGDKTSGFYAIYGEAPAKSAEGSPLYIGQTGSGWGRVVEHIHRPVAGYRTKALQVLSRIYRHQENLEGGGPVYVRFVKLPSQPLGALAEAALLGKLVGHRWNGDDEIDVCPALIDLIIPTLRVRATGAKASEEAGTNRTRSKKHERHLQDIERLEKLRGTLTEVRTNG
jgi:hypothetical protein